MAKKRLALSMNLLRSRFWHRLLGLWLGAVLLLVCLTGSILLLKNPLLQWLYPQLQISLVDDRAAARPGAG
ncbi:MAG: PepSY-associated TM helix domain-containing protein [Rheinheimera sp.]|nr:PepSY-associated TM helix domain-containing protein [Rheinheimera sp.]